MYIDNGFAYDSSIHLLIHFILLFKNMYCMRTLGQELRPGQGDRNLNKAESPPFKDHRM